MSEDEQEQELLRALSADPDFAGAVEHFNQACDAEDAEDGCPVCMALKAIGILYYTSEDYKAPSFVKKVQNPTEVLAMMARISIWFGEAMADFLEFLEANSDDHNHDHDEEEEDEE